MKFRILSDLHLTGTNNNSLLRDVNKTPRLIKSNEDNEENIITLIAGDIASDASTRRKFFKLNPNMKGFFIEGNHIVYNEEHKALSTLVEELKTEYSNTNMKCLENAYVELDNDYVIVGACLWTDFNLNGTQALNMYEAPRYMNDYSWGYEYNDGTLTGLWPRNILSRNQESFNYIKEIVEKFPDKKIIVLTHYCPSAQCACDRYRGSKSNAYYMSNYENFIAYNPNIIAWICGHVHTKKDFMIGNCRVIVNAIGYKHEKHSTKADWNKIYDL
jgi:hypothetical protein